MSCHKQGDATWSTSGNRHIHVVSGPNWRKDENDPLMCATPGRPQLDLGSGVPDLDRCLTNHPRGGRPGKHEIWIQCWLDVGPSSQTVGQHQASFGWSSPKHLYCWIRIYAVVAISMVYRKYKYHGNWSSRTIVSGGSSGNKIIQFGRCLVFFINNHVFRHLMLEVVLAILALKINET